MKKLIMASIVHALFLSSFVYADCCFRIINNKDTATDESREQCMAANRGNVVFFAENKTANDAGTDCVASGKTEAASKSPASSTTDTDNF